MMLVKKVSYDTLFEYVDMESLPSNDRKDIWAQAIEELKSIKNNNKDLLKKLQSSTIAASELENELHLKCKEHDEQTLKLQRAEMNSNETVNSLLEMIGNKRKAEDNAFRDAEWIRPINESHIDYDYCHCSYPDPVRVCIMRGMRGPPPGPKFVHCSFRKECQSKILLFITKPSFILLFFCRYDC